MNINLVRMAAAGLVAVSSGASVVSAQQILDQEQPLFNSGTSARTLPGYTVWQSFTAGHTGTLSEIDMGFFLECNGDGTLRVYSGEGTAGALLQSVAVPVIGHNQVLTWNAWGVSVPITAGSEYTFELTPDASTLPDPYGVCTGANNPYAGGIMGLNPGGIANTPYDMTFRTYVQIPEPGVVLAAFGLCIVHRRRRPPAR